MAWPSFVEDLLKRLEGTGVRVPRKKSSTHAHNGVPSMQALIKSIKGTYYAADSQVRNIRHIVLMADTACRLWASSNPAARNKLGAVISPTDVKYYSTEKVDMFTIKFHTRGCDRDRCLYLSSYIWEDQHFAHHTKIIRVDGTVCFDPRPSERYGMTISVAAFYLTEKRPV